MATFMVHFTIGDEDEGEAVDYDVAVDADSRQDALDKVLHDINSTILVDEA